MSEQRFYINGRNLDTGEERECVTTAADPAAALAKVLRRRSWAEWMLSEQRFRFIVSHEPVMK